MAHTRVPPGALGAAFRHEIQGIDPDLPVFNLWTLAERLERNYWFQRAIGAIGLGGALAVTRILKSVLVQVSPSEPATFAAAALVLSAAAACGCLIPARRAMRVDPVVALYRE